MSLSLEFAWPPPTPRDRFRTDHLYVPEQLFICSPNGDVVLGGPLVPDEFQSGW